MKALILAAGYATRLRPLTDELPKQLLRVGGRPMVDWILEKVCQVEEVDAVHLVTNSRFAPDFERWAETVETRLRPHVHDDGTRSNDDRLGAIGDITFTLERSGIEGDDLLVIAGDNLFDYALSDFVAFWRSKGTASAVAVHDVGVLKLAAKYGVIEVDPDWRVRGFVEKPPRPASTLAATATYLFHREHVPLIRTYLDEGNSPDQPGRLMAWLFEREPVYAYLFEGEWFDIGDPLQLLVADNHVRARLGLPERREYALEEL
ncbi:MAG: nucleotidyltransferase family protein [Gaiellaceae bacterium]